MMPLSHAPQVAAPASPGQPSTLLNPTIQSLPPKAMMTMPSAPQTLVVIDSHVDHIEMLKNGVYPDVVVAVLPPSQDGIYQITSLLRQYPSVTQLHIVSHGAPGCIQLGKTELSCNSLGKYWRLLERWFPYSSAQKKDRPSILMYGCNVAAGEAGADFIQQLHRVTAADINASTTPIGSAALGGNWMLDAQATTQPISDDWHPDLAFETRVLEAYPATLPVTFAENFDASDERPIG